MLFYEIGDGLRGTLYRGRRQLWIKCHIRVARRCHQCGRLMGKKATAYRPVTNQDNRMWRVHSDCMTIVETTGK